MSVLTSCTILGLPPTFDEKQLKAAYRRLMLQWHPDRHFSNPDAVAAAVVKAQELNAAYELLTELLEEGWSPSQPQGSTDHSGGAAAGSHASYKTRHTYQGEAFAPGFPDPLVVEVFLKSSHIISTGYDKARAWLYIKFTGNRVYRYHGVPEQVFEQFVGAESHGKYAYANIYRVFRTDRC